MFEARAQQDAWKRAQYGESERSKVFAGGARSTTPASALYHEIVIFFPIDRSISEFTGNFSPVYSPSGMPEHSKLFQGGVYCLLLTHKPFFTTLYVPLYQPLVASVVYPNSIRYQTLSRVLLSCSLWYMVQQVVYGKAKTQLQPVVYGKTTLFPSNFQGSDTQFQTLTQSKTMQARGRVAGSISEATTNAWASQRIN